MDIFWGDEGFFGGGKFSHVFVGGERFLKFRGCVKEKRFIYVWVISFSTHRKIPDKLDLWLENH